MAYFAVPSTGGADVTLGSSDTADLTLTDAATNSASVMRKETHNTVGTAAAGFGTIDSYELQSGGGTTREAFRITTSWTTATDAAETAQVLLSLRSAGSLAQAMKIQPTQITIPGGVNAGAPGLNFNTAAVAGMYASAAGTLVQLIVNGSGNFVFSDSNLQLAGGVSLTVGAAGALSIDGNDQIWRLADADNSAPMSVMIYNTRASATSFERLTLDWSTVANVCLVGTEKGSGGGTSREFALQIDGTRRIRMDATGLSFFAVAPVARQASAANLTNNVTVGGTDDTIADFTSLTVYATDAAAIRNDIYQLSRKLKQINDGLRLLGLFT